MTIIFMLVFIYYFFIYCNVQIDYLIWINLDRSIQRRINMHPLLSEFEGISNMRMSAIDGKNVNSFSHNIKNQNKNHSNHEYACLLSHLNAILEFQQNKFSYFGRRYDT